jgi:hypothetical protein
MSARLASAIQALLDLTEFPPLTPTEEYRTRVETVHALVAGEAIAAWLPAPPPLATCGLAWHRTFLRGDGSHYLVSDSLGSRSARDAWRTQLRQLQVAAQARAGSAAGSPAWAEADPPPRAELATDANTPEEATAADDADDGLPPGKISPEHRTPPLPKAKAAHRLVIDLLSNTITLDGTAFRQLNPNSIRAFKVYFDGAGATLSSKKVRDSLKGCHHDKTLQRWLDALPQQLRTCLKGVTGSGRYLELPPLV